MAPQMMAAEAMAMSTMALNVMRRHYTNAGELWMNTTFSCRSGTFAL
jgi:hypothetical protein